MASPPRFQGVPDRSRLSVRWSIVLAVSYPSSPMPCERPSRSAV